VKGAFTGAIQRRTGRFELAHGGTIFLDEVSELPAETQVKLLRVLQEGEFERLGSSHTIRVDMRVIAACNVDLSQVVAEGRFRSDLFYRLNVFPLRIPPLRERGSDIRDLAMFFVTRFAGKFGKRIESMAEDSLRRLTEYSWPGNIRELQNVIERAVILCEGPVLRIDPNTFRVAAAAPMVIKAAAAGGGSSISPAPNETAPLTLEESERRHILAALERTRGVIDGPKGAANILKIHPNTLRSRMKKLGITRHEIA
jgi:formate hydrogenlyase transcriptional activator